MSRPLSTTLALSTALHAGAVALLLAHLPVREERPAILAVDVAWVGGEEAGGGGEAAATPAAAAPSDIPADPAPTQTGAAAEKRIETAPTEDAIPEVPAVSPTLAHRSSHATIETRSSPRRRQIVAAPSVDSRHGESLQPSRESASAAAEPVAAAGDHARKGGGSESIVQPGDNPGAGSSNVMAGGGETVYRIAPSYPPAARRRGIEGSVLLRVRFDAAGQPEDIAVAASSGSEMLDQAARDAVQRWRFRGGVSGTVDVPVAFRLRGSDAVQVTDAAGRGK